MTRWVLGIRGKLKVTFYCNFIFIHPWRVHTAHLTYPQVEEGIYDTACSPNPGTCVCHLPVFPTLRLRGLCEGSNIDTEYKLKYLNGSIVYMGVRGSQVIYTGDLG